MVNPEPIRYSLKPSSFGNRMMRDEAGPYMGYDEHRRMVEYLERQLKNVQADYRAYRANRVGAFSN